MKTEAALSGMRDIAKQTRGIYRADHAAVAVYALAVKGDGWPLRSRS